MKFSFSDILKLPTLYPSHIPFQKRYVSFFFWLFSEDSMNK